MISECFLLEGHHHGNIKPKKNLPMTFRFIGRFLSRGQLMIREIQMSLAPVIKRHGNA
jgi:hypothetical protein